jgi:hypothetical protein
MGKRRYLEGRISFEPGGEGDGDEPMVLTVEVKREGKWVRIAKRYSGQNWINLEPGYTVRGSEPGGSYDSIEIEYTSANTRPQ